MTTFNLHRHPFLDLAVMRLYSGAEILQRIHNPARSCLSSGSKGLGLVGRVDWRVGRKAAGSLPNVRSGPLSFYAFLNDERKLVEQMILLNERTVFHPHGTEQEDVGFLGSQASHRLHHALRH